MSALRHGDVTEPAPGAGEATNASTATSSTPSAPRASATPTGATTRPAAASATETGPAAVALRTGPLTTAEARTITKGCTRQFHITARSTAHERFVEVGGAFPIRLLTVVVTATDGSKWGCSAPAGELQFVDGGLLGSKTNPSRTPPRVSLGVSGGVDGKPSTPDFVDASGWAVVAPDATSVRARWSVNGRPGPWVTTATFDGYAFVIAHMEAPTIVGDVLKVEAQVLGATGKVVDRAPAVGVKVASQGGVVGLEPVP
ncbi:hypothetical protein [Terrabacter sp. NPDC080008]|uniref:hypothetical protein n=1 Tax=Terrabacter sp. NPDC080008 TaxID=3155176 RepID=UPI00344CC1D7